MLNLKTIKELVTHGSSFYADDVFAVAIIKLINHKINIIRTRDDNIIRKSKLRVDMD